MLEKHNHLLRKQTTLPLKKIHLLTCLRNLQIKMIYNDFTSGVSKTLILLSKEPEQYLKF